MNRRPIMDAGPGLNFLSLNKERLLFDSLGALAVPEIVEAEILRKARQDKRFAAAARVWPKLPADLLEVLSDDLTAGLDAAVRRLSGLPLGNRYKQSRDLGETMVIAHAAVAAEAGDAVTVLIDDGGGRELATMEARRLDRMKDAGRAVGSIRLIQTTTVLERAAGGEYLPDRDSLRALYSRLRSLDDGLLPLEQTGLLALDCWH